MVDESKTETALRKGISRRKVLSAAVAAAAGGVIVGGAAGYFAGLSAPAQATVTPTKTSRKLTFRYIAWAMTDPNIKWMTEGAKEFVNIVSGADPNVEILVSGPDSYDVAQHVKFLDSAIETNPDGICLHISDPSALQPSLTRAKDKGIPVVSAVSHPPGADAEKILHGLYLTMVGVDDTLVGVRLGERLLQEKTPTHLLVCLPHVGHAGSEGRAAGMFSVMPPGTKTDKMALGDEPTHATDVLTSFLKANPDVDAIFCTALLANKWIWDVVQTLGAKGITLITVDEAPSSLEAVLSGKYLATFSMAFPIIPLFAQYILYVYKLKGFGPVAPVLTGPVVIDKGNAPMFKKTLIDFLGEKAYYDLSPWGTTTTTST